MVDGVAVIPCVASSHYQMRGPRVRVATVLTFKKKLFVQYVSTETRYVLPSRSL